MSLLGERYGFFWRTLWLLPENEQLRAERDHAHALCPGDVVHVPDLRERNESCATGRRHVFRRRGVPSRLSLQLLDWKGNPRPGLHYAADVDGRGHEGESDAEGRIVVRVPCDARSCRLRVVSENKTEEVYDLKLGRLRPVADLVGIKARLNNLGFEAGVPDADLNPRTRDALRAFQLKYGLLVTGEPDEGTRSKVLEVHGS